MPQPLGQFVPRLDVGEAQRQLEADELARGGAAKAMHAAPSNIQRITPRAHDPPQTVFPEGAVALVQIDKPMRTVQLVQYLGVQNVNTAYVSAFADQLDALLTGENLVGAQGQCLVDTLLLLMAPVTPHIAEELWVRRGKPYSIHRQKWPAYDAAAAAEDLITLLNCWLTHSWFTTNC